MFHERKSGHSKFQEEKPARNKFQEQNQFYEEKN